MRVSNLFTDSDYKKDEFPPINSRHIRDVFNNHILKVRANERRYPIDLIRDGVVFPNDIQKQVMFTFGDSKRPHRSRGDAIVAFNWDSLFSGVSEGMDNNLLAIPLLSLLYPVIASQRLLLQPLLYRDLFNKVKFHYGIKDPVTSIKFNAFPLSNLERSLMEYYFYLLKGTNCSSVFMSSLDHFMRTFYSPFVVKSKTKHLQHYSDARDKLEAFNIDLNLVTFFDMMRFDYLDVDVNSFKVSPFDVVDFFEENYASIRTNPVPNSGLLSTMIQMVNCCPYADPKWRTNYSPLRYSATSDLDSNVTMIANQLGVYYDHTDDICLINYAYVPLSFIFGPKSYYATFDKRFRQNSPLYSEALDDPNSKLNPFNANLIASRVRERLMRYHSELYGKAFTLHGDMLHAKGVWDHNFSSSIVGFNFSMLRDVYKESKIQINKSLISNTKKRSKPEPKIPSSYLRETYTIIRDITDPNSETISFDVCFFYFDKNLYINFPTVNLRPLIDESSLPLDTMSHPKLIGELFLTVASFKDLLESDINNAALFPFLPDVPFYIWLRNLAPSAVVFKRKLLIHNKQRKLNKSWSSEEDKFIKDNMRPYMSKALKQAFYAQLSGRTRTEIHKRAKELRNMMLSEGITDISKYPRFRVVEGLNKDIAYLVKEKGFIEKLEVLSERKKE